MSDKFDMTAIRDEVTPLDCLDAHVLTIAEWKLIAQHTNFFTALKEFDTTVTPKFYKLATKSVERNFTRQHRVLECNARFCTRQAKKRLKRIKKIQKRKNRSERRQLMRDYRAELRLAKLFDEDDITEDEVVESPDKKTEQVADSVSEDVENEKNDEENHDYNDDIYDDLKAVEITLVEPPPL